MDHNLLNLLEVGYLEDNHKHNNNQLSKVVVSLVVKGHQEVAACSAHLQLLINLHLLA